MSNFENYMFKKMMSVDNDQFQATILPNSLFKDYLDKMNVIDIRFKLLSEILADMERQDKIDDINNLYAEFNKSLSSSIESAIIIKLDNDDLKRLARINDKERLMVLSGMLAKDDYIMIIKSKDFIKSYVEGYDKICTGLSDIITELTGHHVLIHDNFINESNKEFNDMKQASNSLMMNNRQITMEQSHFNILKKDYDDSVVQLNKYLKRVSDDIYKYFSD